MPQRNLVTAWSRVMIGLTEVISTVGNQAKYIHNEMIIATNNSAKTALTRLCDRLSSSARASRMLLDSTSLMAIFSLTVWNVKPLTFSALGGGVNKLTMTRVTTHIANINAAKWRKFI